MISVLLLVHHVEPETPLWSGLALTIGDLIFHYDVKQPFEVFEPRDFFKCLAVVILDLFFEIFDVYIGEISIFIGVEDQVYELHVRICLLL